MMTIDFYSILPLTSALFMVLFGLFVLFKDTKSRMNQLLFGFCISMLFWLFGTFMMFATRGNLASSVFWDRFVYAGVVFIPPLMHQFSLLFTKQADKQKKLLFINYTLAFFFLIASRTQYFVDGLYYYSWGVHTQAKILHDVFLGYFFLGTGLFFRNVWLYYKKTTDHISKLQTIYVFLAFASIIFVGGSAYLYAYGIDTKLPFAYISGLIFPIMLFYAVSKHHLLGTKVIATEVLVGLTEFLVVMQIFFSSTGLEIAIRVVFAIVIAFIGVLLIRLIQKEVAHRQEVTKLADELQQSNQQLQTLAKSLEQSNQRLKELDKQKSEFLDIASHQLRTPLSALIGLLSMQYDGDFDSLSKTEFKQQQKDMLTSAERLKNIVHDLMDAMEVELGAKLKPEPTDIAKLVEEAINTLRPNYEKKSLYLKYSPPNKPLPTISADPSFLAHIFINLIDNACNYTETGGAEIKLFQEKNQVIFQITDTGIGVTPAEKENLFGKFIRAKRAMLVRPDGSGLGLFIVKKIVEAHGGEVKITSDGENKGSTFKIYLPVKP